MSLSQLINVSIKVAATAPTGPNFSVPAIFSCAPQSPLAPWYAAPITYCTGLSGVTALGFATYEPAYLAAAAILDQEPNVTSFAIAKRTLPTTQVLNLLCSSSSSNDVYTFALTGADGVVNQVIVASTGTSTTDATSIKTTINGLSNVGTATVSSSTVIITQAAGKFNNVSGWAGLGVAGSAILALTDASTNPGIATDLSAIAAIDHGWYGYTLESNSKAEIIASAAWCEANAPHVFFTNTSDGTNISGTTVGAFHSMLALTYARTFCQFNGSELLSYGGAAALGEALPQVAGSYTLAYKALTGVPADPASILTATAITNLNTNNGNYYTTFQGQNVLISGITPSGEFIDVTIFIDWLAATIQTAVFALLVANPKIPYTDGGVAAIVSVIKGCLGQGIQNGGLAASPAPTVSAPLVSSIPLSNVAARNVPSITFTATLAGAIQSLSISGTVVLP